MAEPGLRRELRLRDLVLLNISAIVGVRWLSAAAHAGPGSITLWILAAVFFFLPSALVVASLSKRFPEEGGLYIWTKAAFGDWHGFLCAWFYFLGNLIYFPTLLLAGAAMSSYIFGPAGTTLAETREYTLPVTLIALWAAFLINFFGLKAGKWAANFGAICTYAIFLMLLGFGAWSWLRSGSASHFNLIPDASFDNLNFWSQIAFAYVGLELGAILSGEIYQPEKTVPRAAWISGIACAAFYILGTSALLLVVPPETVSVVTGLAQAGSAAGQRLGIAWLSPLFALLISLGIAGQTSSFVAGNTRLPFVIGLDSYLPPIFAKLHPRWRTPYASILFQGALACAFLLAAQLGETLRAAYQTLVDMCVITTFIPFVYIFAAAFKFGQKWAGASGLAVSLLAIVLSALPPPEVASGWIFELKIVGGCLVLGYLGWLTFTRSKAAFA